MNLPAQDDEFLHRIRVRPTARFAHTLKTQLDDSSTKGGYSMQSYIPGAAPMSPRTVLLFGIVGFHIALIYALAHGLVRPPAPIELVPMTGNVVTVEPQHIEQPQLPQPKLQDTFEIPIPETQPEIPIDTLAGAAIDPPVAPPPAASSEGTPVVFVPARIGKNFPDPDSFYPSQAIREEIEGKAIVRVCVGPNGRLAEAPQIAQSTHNRLLDDAALRLARAGNYVAGSRGGVAITDCFNFQTTFQLKNRR